MGVPDRSRLRAEIAVGTVRLRVHGLFFCGAADDLPGPGPEVAAAGLRRRRRAGCRHAHAAQRAGLGARGPRLSLHRPARRGQDHHRAPPRQGAGVHRARGEPEACGACPSCLDFASGAPVDVLEIDAASNNGVDEIRTLRENVKYSPARGRFKVYIVDEVHMLSGAAFNAFLKTLEEPPAHVVFILATTDPKRIPPTVLSRCQRFDFRPIPPELLTARLTEILPGEGRVRAGGAAAADPGSGGQPARRALAAGRRHRLRRGQAGGGERGRAARLGLAGARARHRGGPPRGRRRRRARGDGPRRAPGRGSRRLLPRRRRDAAPRCSCSRWRRTRRPPI